MVAMLLRITLSISYHRRLKATLPDQLRIEIEYHITQTGRFLSALCFWTNKPIILCMEEIRRGFTRLKLSRHSLIYGIAAVIILLWWVYTPPGLLGKADAIGYAVCHRIGERSFHIAGRQMPLCARCTGMYLGSTLGLAYQFITQPRKAALPPRKILAVMAFIVIFWAVDGTNSYLHLFPNAPGLYQPNNVLRLLTGSGIGMVVAMALFPVFNQTVWSEYDPRPAVAGFHTLGKLALMTLAMDALVLSEHPLILYPAALISAAGVLILLSIVYGMILLMLTKAENKIQTFQQVSLPLAAGLIFAILQVSSVSYTHLTLPTIYSV